jgi:hypothetical protein
MLRMLLAAIALSGLALVTTGCGLPIPGMGGGAGAWKPESVMNNAYTGDLTGAKEGQYVTYAMEASGNKTTMTTKVLGKSGDDTLVEVWTDAGSMAYGVLYAVGADKVVTNAWAAAKDDKEWTKITVTEPPKAEAATDGPKPVIKESDEKKTVAAGEYDAHRIDTTVNVQGTDYSSTTWVSKDVPGIGMSTPQGGIVAMEASGSVTSLEAKGDDAKPTIPLPAAE